MGRNPELTQTPFKLLILKQDPAIAPGGKAASTDYFISVQDIILAILCAAVNRSRERALR
jgi:hypothetical protein